MAAETMQDGTERQEAGQDRRGASDPRWLAAGAAGLVAAILALWSLRGLPGGAISLWMVPLPLFMAGIGFGTAAMFAALALAAIAMLLVGSTLATGLFLAALGVPAVALYLAAPGRPVPKLGFALTLLGLLPAVGVAVAALMLADEPGGLEGTMRIAVEHALTRMGLPLSDGLVAELVRVKPAAIGFWVAMALLLNAAIASTLLVRARVIPAAPAWREARLPSWYLVLPALALGLWLAADPGTDAVELSLLLTLLVPVFLHGLAGFHRATSALRGRPVVLGGAYAALLVISVPVALAVTGYGLYDILNGTRGRRSAPPQS